MTEKPTERHTWLVPLRTGRGMNERLHHMERHRRNKAEQEAVLWMLGNKPRPELPCTCTLTRMSPANATGVWQGLDDDNLRGSLKAVRDAAAKWVGVDDADPRVRYAYEQRCGEWHVMIRFHVNPEVQREQPEKIE
jgi:hypothetical protein